MKKNVLLGNMSCLADAGDPNVRYQQFLQVGKVPFKCLIESVILFDQVIIPTNDFMPLSLIAGVLGERPLIGLLDDEIIKFARFKGSLCYLGNGGGVSVFQVHAADTIEPKYFSAPLDQAATAAINAVNTNINKKRLSELASQATVEFQIEVEALRAATYAEIKATPSIIKAKGLVDVRRLKGIEPNQVRLLSGVLREGQDDDIFQVLRVAQACVEAKAAATTNCDDIYTSDQVSELFQGALTRAARISNPGEVYVELRELADLPDIGDLILKNKGAFGDLIKLRNSNSGVQFRRWFHENARKDPAYAGREYIKMLQQVPGIQTASAKTIRFLAQIGVGVVGAAVLDPGTGLLAGVSASAVDSYLIERVFRGSSPKVFLERLQKLAAERMTN